MKIKTKYFAMITVVAAALMVAQLSNGTSSKAASSSPKYWLHKFAKRFPNIYSTSTSSGARGPASTHGKAKAKAAPAGVISKNEETEKLADRGLDYAAVVEKMCGLFLKLNTKDGELSKEAQKAITDAFKEDKADEKDGAKDPKQFLKMLAKAFAAMGQDKDADYASLSKTADSFDAKEIMCAEQPEIKAYVKKLNEGRMQRFNVVLAQHKIKTADDLQKMYAAFLTSEEVRAGKLSVLQARREHAAVILGALDSADKEDEESGNLPETSLLKKKFPKLFATDENSEDSLDEEIGEQLKVHGENLAKHSTFHVENTMGIVALSFADELAGAIAESMAEVVKKTVESIGTSLDESIAKAMTNGTPPVVVEPKAPKTEKPIKK